MKAPTTMSMILCLLLAGTASVSCQQTKQNKPAAQTAADTTVVQQSQVEVKEPDRPSIFVSPERMPLFPGGEKALMDFLYKNMRYPDQPLEPGSKSRVICTFVVTEKGKITDIEVARGVNPEVDKEAVRLIRMMPDWLPGEKRGKPAPIKYTLPIQFNRPDTVVKEDSSSLFILTQKMPLFPGGDAAMMNFLRKNIRYPDQPLESRSKGRVICSFIVTETGKITDIEVVRGVNPEVDKEAVRLIRMMPDWQPGEERGKPVPIKYTLPIQFYRAGTQEQASPQIFGPKQKMPVFPGGESAMMDFIYKNIRYPDSAPGVFSSGRVICTFVVTETGKITDVEVVRGVNPELDKEAIRLIQSMPDWQPGEERGKPIPIKYTLPIQFKKPESKQ